MAEQNARTMRLLYSSDLHGSEGHYARLVAAAKTHRPQVIILGGDMLPDDSALQPETLGRGQPEFVRVQFRELILNLREACRPAAILAIFGNHDWASSATAMNELANEGLLSILNHKTPLETGGLAFLGYSSSPPTPWFVKDFERLDLTGDTPPLLGGARWDARFSKPSAHGAEVVFGATPSIEEELADLKPPPQPWVLVAHAPPFDTNLDRSYKGESWGSRAIRAALERHQPLLSLHGHVHESPIVTGSFTQQLGETTAVNPGQSHDKLRYAIIDLDVAARKITDMVHGQEA